MALSGTSLYRRGFEGLARWFLVAARVILVAMLGLILVEIILRNFFLLSTRISDEYSGYLSLWLTLLGFLHAARTDSFIRVSFLWARAKGRRFDLLVLGGASTNLAVCAVVFHASLNLMVTSYQFHATSSQWSQTLLFIPQAIMPVSFGLLGILYIEEIVRRLVSLARRGAARGRRAEA